LSPNPLFPRCRLFTVLLAVGLVVVNSLGAWGADDRKDRKKEPLQVPPPQPVPQEIKVERGEDIIIPLKIYGRRNQPLTFLVRKNPKAGQLSGLKNVEAEAAIIHYRSNRDRSMTRDSFEYAVRSAEGVSAPVLVQIEIIDQPPDLAGPGEVPFSQRLVGTEETQTIEFINRGGMTAAGTCEVSGAWRLESPPEYRIDPGGHLFVKVTFNPDRPGDFLGELRLTSQRERTIVLRGTARTALEVKPALLRLGVEAATQIRAGVFELTNNTETELTVRFQTSERLRIDPEIKLRPNATVPVMVRTAPQDAALLEAEVTVQAGSYQTKVPVTAAPLPAIIRPVQRTLDLGFAPSNGLAYGQLQLRNEGGVVGIAQVTAQEPFHLDAQRYEVGAGTSVDVPISVEGFATGTIERSLQIQTSLGTTEVPLRVVIGGLGARAPKASVSSSSSSSSSSTTPAPAAEVLPLTVHDLDFEKKVDLKEIVRIAALEPTHCVFDWSADFNPAKTFIAEQRELVMEGGQFSVRWNRLYNFEFAHQGDRVRGTVKSLLPGHRYTVRVLALTPKGGLGAQVFQTTFDTPGKPKTGPKISLLAVLSVLGTGLIGVALWLRFRPKPAPKVIAKKTQRIF